MLERYTSAWRVSSASVSLRETFVFFVFDDRGSKTQTFLRWARCGGDLVSLCMQTSSVGLRWICRAARRGAGRTTRPVAPGASCQASLSSLSSLSQAGTPLACNVYVSEGRDKDLLSQLEAVVKSLAPGVHLGHVFVDTAYNRTGYTLVSSSVDGMVRGVVAVSKRALELIDLRRHEATHPRLGVVDHVSCHPLVDGDAAMDAARSARGAIGKALEIRAWQHFYMGMDAT